MAGYDWLRYGSLDPAASAMQGKAEAFRNAPDERRRRQLEELAAMQDIGPTYGATSLARPEVLAQAEYVRETDTRRGYADPEAAAQNPNSYMYESVPNYVETPNVVNIGVEGYNGGQTEQVVSPKHVRVPTEEGRGVLARIRERDAMKRSAPFDPLATIAAAAETLPPEALDRLTAPGASVGRSGVKFGSTAEDTASAYQPRADAAVDVATIRNQGTITEGEKIALESEGQKLLAERREIAESYRPSMQRELRDWEGKWKAFQQTSSAAGIPPPVAHDSQNATFTPNPNASTGGAAPPAAPKVATMKDFQDDVERARAMRKQDPESFVRDRYAKNGITVGGA